MTSNQRNKLVWATVIAYTLSHFLLFQTRLQDYGGLIVVGICAIVISVIYIRTNKTITKSEKIFECISSVVIFIITVYMFFRASELIGH